jgi:3-hydroxyacyl-CoA dehydrogenase
MDIAGLDVLALVVKDLQARLPAGDRDAFKAPALLERLLAAGRLGEKRGAGFYKRVKKANGESEILALDPATLDYRAQAPIRLGSLEQAKTIENVGARIRALFLGSDRVGQFLRATLAPTLVYCADHASEVAHSLGDVDRVLQ